MSGYAKISGNTDWNTPTKYVYKINEFFSEIDVEDDNELSWEDLFK